MLYINPNSTQSLVNIISPIWFYGKGGDENSAKSWQNLPYGAEEVGADLN